MSEISSKFTIIDGFSNPLTKFANKLNESIHKMTGMNSAADKMTEEVMASDAAMKRFTSDLGKINIGQHEINAAANDMHRLAQTTVFSNDQMLNSYTKLANSGVQSTGQMTRGLANLANSAKNPETALKELTTVASTLGDKPKVEWSKFKSLLDTTPESVMKMSNSMHTTMEDLIHDIQAGTIKTKDLMNAMNRAGNSLGGNKIEPPQMKSPKMPSSPEVSMPKVSGGSMFKSMIGANLVTNGIMAGVNAAKNGISSLVSEMNESSKAWATFDGNMEQLHMPTAKINAVRGELQKFAQDTIYSSSDMASTYSQLAAVGTKNTTQLVKGFGGLAASATDPTQAMKTLSQQATQMAAKPKVQWADFKLMMDQAPAGVSAVAKSMHTNLQSLIQDVQSGKLKTQDFFDAVAKTGTNKTFSKMATQYKTVGQAADGLKETIGNKLQHSFEDVSKVGINAISSINDKLGDMNFDGIGKKIAPALSGLVKFAGNALRSAGGAVKAFFDSFNQTGAISKVVGFVKTAGQSISHVFGSMSGNGKNPFSAFQVLGKIAGGVIGGLAKDLTAIANAVKGVNPNVIKALGVGFLVMKMSTRGLVITGIVMGLTMLSKLNPAVLNVLAGALVALGIALAIFKGVSGISSTFNALKTGLGGLSSGGAVKKIATGTTTAASGMIKMGAAALLLGAGVALAGGGLWIMANAAISLANAGWPAVAIMFGMIAAVGILAAVVAIAGSAMIVGAIGFAIFGAALILVGIAVFIAAAGVTLLATQLPNIANYGLIASVNIMALGFAMAIFGAFAIVASVGIVILSAALVIGAAAMVVAAIGAVVLGAGAMILGAGLTVAGIGALILAAGIAAVALALMLLITVVSNAINGVVNAVRNGMNNVKNGVSNGIQGAINAAKSFVGGFTSAGSWLVQGLANGIKSGIGAVINAAKGVASAAMGWIHKTLHIGSPSKLTHQYGRWVDQGLANGINRDTKLPANQAKKLANGVIAPFDNMDTPTMPNIEAGSVGQYNAGDMLTDSFSNALGMIGSIHQSLNKLPNNTDLNVNRNDSLQSSGSYNGSSLTTAQASGISNSYSNSNSSNSNDTHLHLNDGAIQINSSGDADYDGERIVEAMEKFLRNRKEGALGY
ncbi:tape measure protein [Apilactobacillus xinyiensis]|uniref:tape measure protein n=1 Tax=Apilactobacillus xinyiensis TaxID=2841032 RepID=UPI0020108E4F|nr:tape measure protein [Apilactobacillus xinyiensis]MCL0330616.1 tape measure protein [Apilactobacillus xinyiensis]